MPLAVSVDPDSETEPGDHAVADRRWAHALRAGGLVAFTVALAFVALLSIWLGSRDIPFIETWDVLVNRAAFADSDTAVVIHDYRIPRTLLGITAGVALGLSGALMQALTRNPLAEPGLLGVNTGASAGMVVAIAFLGVTSVLGYVWFALAGAAVASLAVYVLGATGRGAASPERLVLAGAAITAVLYAFNTAVLLSDPEAYDEYRFWMVGSLAGRYYDVLLPLLPFVAVGAVIALLLMRPLNALSMGDDLAGALGARPGLIRAFGAIAVTLLCGAATAAIGPIGFVGLAVPHAARLLVGPDHRWVLPYSLVLAPLLLVAADVVGRVIAPPGEVQVGIVTAAIGVPVFVMLCRRRRLAGL
ncbi:iron chelate uptake ABC transporter family permease subunit [Saccharomonospora xinjiangensis]|uniref:FecCD family ABC transporter permease n=1 Tax=Saccharomonospora xinjiangensis TaxID=75294 RepID=UPI00106F41D6|nr:iron chelate uptake ABC transporter family permease subunit [Saccharomonospora xinjiangensis]QBQ58683.1 Ferric enterobactin transport system permease protein FepD [Saccharomonospora xinjiangensis]